MLQCSNLPNKDARSTVILPRVLNTAGTTSYTKPHKHLKKKKNSLKMTKNLLTTTIVVTHLMKSFELKANKGIIRRKK